MLDKNFDDLIEWLRYGIDKGWCTDSVCYFHDSPEWTDEEEADIEEYGEICLPIIRLWA